jgi:hypothetical protein
MPTVKVPAVVVGDTVDRLPCNAYVFGQDGVESPSIALFAEHLLEEDVFPCSNDNTIETSREDLRDKSTLYAAKL